MKRITFVALMGLACQLNAQTPFANFETWRQVPVLNTSVNLELPTKWYSTDSLVFYAGNIYPDTFYQQCFKTSDSYTGSNAIKLVSKMQGSHSSLGVLPALITNANVDIDLTVINPKPTYYDLLFSGGTPVTQRITNLSAWVKYYPKGTDTAAIWVEAIVSSKIHPGEDSVVGTGITYLKDSVESYKKVNVSVHYSSTSVIPEKFYIFVASGSVTRSNEGSTLYVDDISIDYTTSINNLSSENMTVSIYPNPSEGKIFFKTKSKSKFDYYLMNSTGKIIDYQKIEDGISIDYNYLSSGFYTYSIFRDRERQLSGKLIIR